MASILTGFLKRVIKVRVEGPIDQKLYLFYLCRTDSITLGFQKGKNYIPEAVVVVINSSGGSLSQAKHIADILKNYSARKKYLSHNSAPLSIVLLRINVSVVPT